MDTRHSAVGAVTLTTTQSTGDVWVVFFQAESGMRDAAVTGVQTCVFLIQGEDGIRDATVTGVQTCALPILNSSHGSISYAVTGVKRSEERRVGKEGRT